LLLTERLSHVGHGRLSYTAVLMGADLTSMERWNRWLYAPRYLPVFSLILVVLAALSWSLANLLYFLMSEDMVYVWRRLWKSDHPVHVVFLVSLAEGSVIGFIMGAWVLFLYRGVPHPTPHAWAVLRTTIRCLLFSWLIGGVSAALLTVLLVPVFGQRLGLPMDSESIAAYPRWAFALGSMYAGLFGVVLALVETWRHRRSPPGTPATIQ
jgi:hypothetical protein